VPFTFRDGSVPGICKVCGEKAWTPRSNKCPEHKVTPPINATPRSHKKKTTTPPRLNADGGPTLSQVVSSAVSIDNRTFSGKPPTAKEWEDTLSSVVVLLTMTYVEYMVVKPFKIAEPAATQWVSSLGMNDDEARTIVEPCSFLLAKSEINKKHGRDAIEILAFAPAILAIVAWADRVSRFRADMQQQLGEGTHVSFESVSDPQSPGGTSGPVVNFVGNTDPSQAPTARVNGNRAHVDLEAEPVA
jgi:hypothetical protein